jgi:orotate phosphoribosyltransferase
VTNDQALDLFKNAGALLSGHFKLSSGLHSDQYLEKFRLVEEPAVLDSMCRELADRFRTEKIDLVLGPTTAGIILAYAVALHLGVPARYAELEEGERRLRRGQTLPEGARVLVVDDILTTGQAVRECIGVVERHGAVLAGVGILGDRSGGKVQFGAPMKALLTVDVTAWDPAECPLCATGTPMTQPGSRGMVKAGPPSH